MKPMLALAVPLLALPLYAADRDWNAGAPL
jgi:hypothetical protein